MSLTSLSSLVKIGAVTAAGAFLGALNLATVPTTWADWKHILIPAVGSAIAAEIVFLRGTINAFLSGNTPSGNTPSPSPPAAVAVVVQDTTKETP